MRRVEWMILIHFRGFSIFVDFPAKSRARGCRGARRRFFCGGLVGRCYEGALESGHLVTRELSTLVATLHLKRSERSGRLPTSPIPRSDESPRQITNPSAVTPARFPSCSIFALHLPPQNSRGCTGCPDRSALINYYCSQHPPSLGGIAGRPTGEAARLCSGPPVGVP